MLLPNILLCLTAAINLTAAMNIPGLFTRTETYTCPHPMTYCPWTKACACPPGQTYNAKKKTCTGDKIKGCWPKPTPDTCKPKSDHKEKAKNKKKNKDTGLAAYCATSPTEITEYDPRHEYCQASINTLTFTASSAITKDLDALHGKKIDLNSGNISPELKNVCAGLSGLYLPDLSQANTLFNTNKFNLCTLLSEVIGSLPSGIIDVVRKLTCLIGLGQCKHDCVGYCTKGCKNDVGLGGEIGGLLEGLNGCCLLDGVVDIGDGAGGVVECVTEDLLCVVGNVVEEVLEHFDCQCGDE